RKRYPAGDFISFPGVINHVLAGYIAFAKALDSRFWFFVIILSPLRGSKVVPICFFYPATATRLVGTRWEISLQRPRIANTREIHNGQLLKISMSIIGRPN